MENAAGNEQLLSISVMKCYTVAWWLFW